MKGNDERKLNRKLYVFLYKALCTCETRLIGDDCSIHHGPPAKFTTKWDELMKLRAHLEGFGWFMGIQWHYIDGIPITIIGMEDRGSVLLNAEGNFPTVTAQCGADHELAAIAQLFAAVIDKIERPGPKLVVAG